MPDNEIRDQLAAIFREQYAALPLGQYPTGRAIIDAILAAGWRPPAEPVGYITGYRNADGDWQVPFDGTPFTTRAEAQDDAKDASRDGLFGVDWRALTVYDETGEPYRAGEHS